MTKTKERLNKLSKFQSVIGVAFLFTLIYLLGLAGCIENDTMSMSVLAVRTVIATAALGAESYILYQLQLCEDILVARLNRYNASHVM